MKNKGKGKVGKEWQKRKTKQEQNPRFFRIQRHKFGVKVIKVPQFRLGRGQKRVKTMWERKDRLLSFSDGQFIMTKQRGLFRQIVQFSFCHQTSAYFPRSETICIFSCKYATLQKHSFPFQYVGLFLCRAVLMLAHVIQLAIFIHKQNQTWDNHCPPGFGIHQKVIQNGLQSLFPLLLETGGS